MLIDWFTVVAQALNFVILVWLLKRFLYKPILNAIDAREKRIASELADADAKKADADKDRDELTKKNKAFDDERSGLLNKASEEAKAKRDKLIAQAQKDADGLRDAQNTALKDDQTKLGIEITRLARDEVFAIARKTLADLSTVSLEERLGEVFTRRLREMPAEAKLTMAQALKVSAQSAVLTSTFDLPSDQQSAIRNALNETFSTEVPVRFETRPNDVCGIEFSVGGQKIAWSIDQYLVSLNQKVSTLIDAQPKPTGKTEATPEPAPTLASVAHAGAR